MNAEVYEIFVDLTPIGQKLVISPFQSESSDVPAGSLS